MTIGAPGQDVDVVLSQPHGGRSQEDGDALLELVTKGSIQAAILVASDLDETFEQVHASGAYVQEAIRHEEAGTELPSRPEEELASELIDRLAADDELAEAFENLTPGRRRECNLHVSDAKLSSTRERRVDKIVPRILSGKGLRDR